MSNTKHLADLVKVCSILPALVIMPAMAGTGITSTDDGGIFEYNDSSDMYTMISNGTVGGFSGYDASDRFEAAVIFVGKGQELTVSDRVTIQNNKAQVGGAIAITGNDAGATLNIGKGVKFLNNTALFDGGAIGNYGNTIVADGVLFQGNKAQLEPENNPNQIGGGAISLGSKSKTTLVNTDFMYNESGYNGGAIGTRLAEKTEGGYNDNSRAILKIVDGDFEGNKATGYVNSDDELVAGNGGAIYNTFYADVTVDDSQFESNYAAKDGGAIYNDGTADLYGNGGVMTITDADFDWNTAANFGGAIYNSGDLILSDADFASNTAGNGGAIFNKGLLTVDADSEFIRNTAALGGGAIYNGLNATIDVLSADFKSNSVMCDNGGHASGGAIFNGGTIGSIVGVFNDNVAIASDKSLTAKGGAIYSWADRSAHATIDSIVADFNGNQVISVGDAIGGAIVNDGKIGTLYQAGQGFVGNKADAEGNAWAGAFYNSEYAEIKELIANFDDNSANGVIWGAGGAVVNRGNIDKLQGNFTNNSVVATTESDSYGAYGGALFNDGVIGALTGDFINNSAFATMEEYASGGAIENMGTLALVGNNLFRNNVADYGGAIDNWGALNIGGTNVFSNNIARFGGGAISNWETEIVLSGTNTFSGNTANGVANDIYNDGTLTIASGMTSIDGGINGAGALDIKSDATLNINYASIEQDTINIDGTLMASLLNDKDVVDITGALSGTGTVLLSAGATGTYDVSLFADANLGVDFGKTYDVEFNDDNTKATLTTRDAQSIAADTGASIAAAGAVSGLAASTDATIQQVSLRAQAALNNGDIALVEKEMAKANPDTKPVSQSVAASVQNQVVTMAAGRMSAIGGGATGRAGGDVTGAGVWTQGMFNKSKFADKFHGYTRGFAIGGDTLIDNVLTIGGGYAFSNSDIHADGRNMDVENNSIFMYAQYKPAAWYVNATLNYTKSDYADASTVFGYLLNDEYETKSYGAQAMFGYDFANGVTPEFGMRYLHVSQEDHVDVMNREIAGMDADFLSGVAGLKYAFTIESDSAVKFSPTMRAAMTYDFLSDDATATVVMPGASAYYVDVDRLSRLGGEFGIGLTAEYRGLEVSLNYELDLHQDYTSQTGLLKFRYDF